MGKLTKKVKELLKNSGIDMSKVTPGNKFLKSLESYINSPNKLEALFSLLPFVIDKKIPSNKNNDRYNNHKEYENAYHCHIQENFILVYDYDLNGKVMLIDLTDHNNRQSKG